MMNASELAYRLADLQEQREQTLAQVAGYGEEYARLCDEGGNLDRRAELAEALEMATDGLAAIANRERMAQAAYIANC